MVIELFGWAVASAAACLLFSSSAIASPHESPKDSDQDGLHDALELRTGTDPLRADTDSDSTDDGVEDRNRDGKVSPGETDPRRPGLFPGTAPHIPEPLVFDLVRGLGAERGELEVNALAVVDGKTGTVYWAPEIEWAFARGHAIELELPIVDRHLEAVKLALQGTLPSRGPTFTHGWQVFAEVGLDHGQTDLVAVYLLGQRFARRWSYLAMLGANAHLNENGQTSLPLDETHGDRATGIGNFSVFCDVREWQTWGLETNTVVIGSGDWAFRAFPQVHLQLNQRIRIQLSVGMEVNQNEVVPLFALRGILE